MALAKSHPAGQKRDINAREPTWPNQSRTANRLNKAENRKPSNGLEPLTPSLPWKSGVHTEFDLYRRSGLTVAFPELLSTRRGGAASLPSRKFGRKLDARTSSRRRRRPVHVDESRVDAAPESCRVRRRCSI
jgi:hypothetical protein